MGSIIENNYSSALIMEDDMDWDVRLKTQLEKFATGARTMFPAGAAEPHVSSTHNPSPYGDDWDLLWLGHCGEVFPETLPENKNLDPEALALLSRKARIENDPTMPPPDKVTGYQDFKASPHTRWVHVTGGPICTFAYALSARGARKLLFDLSVDHLNGPFDNSLADLCRFGREESRLGMKCVSSTPGLFFHHKAKGYVGGDSDIQKVGGEEITKGKIREKGSTENVVWSARNNIKQMIMGLTPESQYED